MNHGAEWSRPPFHEGEYKCTYLKPFVFFCLFSLPLFLATVLLVVALFKRATVESMLLYIPVGSIAAGLSVPLIANIVPLRLTSKVISGVNAYGTRQTFVLADITRVTFPWYGVGQFWVVHSSKSKMKLWIPLFLADMDDFLDGLSRTVAEVHPLRTCVAQYCSKHRKRNR